VEDAASWRLQHRPTAALASDKAVLSHPGTTSARIEVANGKEALQHEIQQKREYFYTTRIVTSAGRRISASARDEIDIRAPRFARSGERQPRLALEHEPAREAGAAVGPDEARWRTADGMPWIRAPTSPS